MHLTNVDKSDTTAEVDKSNTTAEVDKSDTTAEVVLLYCYARRWTCQLASFINLFLWVCVSGGGGGGMYI